MTRRSQPRLWPLLLLHLLAVSAAWAQQQPHASLDRQRAELGESVTLTVHVASSNPGADPDFTALQNDFEVVNPRRSTRHVIRNGRAESATEWQVTLLPRRIGMLTIPPLAVGATATQRLQLEVTPASARQASGEPVFLETEIDKDAVYVAEQLVFTVRLHYAVPLDEMSLSEPAFDDATVEKLEQNTFERDIDGTTYRVHELRYAIFPETPGTLVIPELVFTASQPLRPRSLFDFPGRGRPISRLTPPIEVAVRPIPDDFTGPVWLPASQLTLVESWSANPLQLASGDSVTRTLTVRADGLPAHRLPALPSLSLDPIKAYPDQPVLENTSLPSGIQGVRRERTAVIATQPGSTTLPGTRVIWWDTTTDTQQEAVLAPRQLIVSAGAAAPAPAVTAPAAMPDNAPADGATTAAPAAANRFKATWPLIAALTALAWVITLGLYLRLRRRLSHEGRPGRASQRAIAPAPDDEAACFDALAAACRTSDPHAARRALLAWARHYYGAPTLHSTQRLDAHLSLSESRAAVAALDRAAFDADSTWDGKSLLTALEAERRRKTAEGHNKGVLKSLYPTA